jgi:hypothetical protein
MGETWPMAEAEETEYARERSDHVNRKLNIL